MPKRNSNPPNTSLEAWRSITKEQLSEHHAKILCALRDLKSASAEQLSTHTNLTHHQVNRRMSELERLELIYRTGAKVATRTGRSASCWSLRNPSEAPKKVTEKILPGRTISDFSKAISNFKQPELF
jgi:predicted ArsR family transcriptional regulator